MSCRLSPTTAIVRDAERRGRVLGVRLPLQDEVEDEPWTLLPSRRPAEPPFAGELPGSLELVLADQICVANRACTRACATARCA
jgi:hypothetical protein